MAGPTAVTRSKTVTPSLVDPDQSLKASKALLAHIKKSAKESAVAPGKKNLLEDADEEGAGADTPIFVTLTTKRHIRDSSRLQPNKIVLPHALNTDPETTICVITADPQRHYKNLVASDAFPEELRKRITRVIDLTHLKAKFNQYEAQRKLRGDHDIFVADDRIINRLPKVLGKVFYKSTIKRPIPAVFQKSRQKVDGKRVKRDKAKAGDDVNSRPAAEVAAEIEKAVGAALVNLSPSTNTAVVVGYAGWKPEHLSANVEALVQQLVDKLVPSKWDNVKSVFIKSPHSTALPVWQTDSLWLEGKDVVEDGSEAARAIEDKKEKANVGKKRKSIEAAGPGEGKEEDEEKPSRPAKKSKKAAAAAAAESNDDKLDKSIAERKAKLKKQKSAAKKAMDA
ncbi:uncharacterized protein E0L32_010022 [Thyridium curvatum]|uniref:Ribosomal protein L1 n=1 Tax=Thyridium curvatum TaxID=1093900 RepID=A0A507AFW6_9PEZI|nr:uncharacterized protein E0L32_010022 [Thyridium curvatum]TPX08535.1 hypothetical protein E0L32_010022 [Thyridium curvatum]